MHFVSPCCSIPPPQTWLCCIFSLIYFLSKCRLFTFLHLTCELLANEGEGNEKGTEKKAEAKLYSEILIRALILQTLKHLGFYCSAALFISAAIRYCAGYMKQLIHPFKSLTTATNQGSKIKGI